MTLRRIGAYIIDYILVFLFLTMLLQIRFLNPNYEEYASASNKVQAIIDKAVEEKDIGFNESDEYKEASYNLQKNSIVPSILTLLVYVGYYCVFAIATHGQTLGKKLFRIKIANSKEEKLRWYQVVIREVILYNILFQGILLMVLVWASKEVYFLISGYTNLIATIIFYSSLLMLILKKDKRTIHDLISNTKVIEE